MSRAFCCFAGKGEPALAGAALQNVPAVVGQSLCHFIGAVIDNAGAEEQAIGLEESIHHGGEADDHIRHDVGHHNVIAAAQSGAEHLVRQHIAHQNGVGILADAVEGGIFIGHRQALVVNVHSHGALGAQLQCGDGENAAAAAQIQNLLAAVDILFQSG